MLRSKPYMREDQPLTEEPETDNLSLQAAAVIDQLTQENAELREKLHQVNMRLADVLLCQTEEEAEPTRRAL